MVSVTNMTVDVGTGGGVAASLSYREGSFRILEMSLSYFFDVMGSSR